MKILKFGGTSVGSPEAIKQTIQIILKSGKSARGVVVSAFSKVTDQLIQMANLAARPSRNEAKQKLPRPSEASVGAALGDENYRALLKDLEHRHIEAVKNLLKVQSQSSVLANVKMKINELEDILRGVFLVKELSARVLDLIMSFGERLSAYIISEAIRDRGVKCEALDSREIVKTDDNFGNAGVDFNETYKNIKKYFVQHKALQIITGFIASTSDNETTTLGRGGSDYSAAIFGAGLNANVIEIWTDVSGVMTADPRKVKASFPISRVTYEEAMEMSYFGAKVIHPPTLQPALEKNIPIHIKNTFEPDAEGTVICKKFDKPSDFLITGISSIHDAALLRVFGSGMIGVSGVSMRLFGALARAKINVILISQASSEHSICFAIDPRNADGAKKIIEEEFVFEIEKHRIEKVLIERELSIIAIVGENMRHRRGIAGKLFQALGRNGINVVTIAQGSSELNISVVISRSDEEKALNVVHDAFFLSGAKSLNVFLVGTGLIGGTLLKQIAAQKEILKHDNALDINVVATANSKEMVFGNEKEKMDIKKFIERMKKLNLANSVFVDCTADEGIAARYAEIMQAHISIVTPNKKANCATLKYYRHLKEISLKHNVKFLYETNVGAGLPVINTLNDLLATGDKILKIEAILSGTLSYIFNEFKGKKRFSEIVKEAKKKGFTEPDPRDDLSGTDVARKLLILGREIGLEFELQDIKVENLIPVSCRKVRSAEDFLKKLQDEDEFFEKLKRNAQKQNQVLRYIGSIENGRASVKLQEVSEKHPFYNMAGSDNIISFTTQRYKNTPLVIKGPGAGADVTAAGVFADIIRISNYLM